MRALVFERFGEPDVIEWREVADPTPGPGEALVRTQAVGLNFADVYRRKGIWRPPGEAPWINGFEAAGVVEAIGPGAAAAGIAVGDRVGFADSPRANAELVSVPAEKLIILPENISTEVAAAVLLQGLTAHYLVHDSYKVRAADYVVIHAAAGGVGLLLVQLAKRLGARPIGLASTEQKRAAARDAGAEEAFGYENWVEAVQQYTGRGANVVYDSSGERLSESLEALRIGGHAVFFGMAGGVPDPVDPRVLMERSLSLTGGDLWNVLSSAQERRRRAAELFSWIEDGSVRVKVAERFPLAAGAEAHRLLESRTVSGKVLLVSQSR